MSGKTNIGLPHSDADPLFPENRSNVCNAVSTAATTLVVAIANLSGVPKFVFGLSDANTVVPAIAERATAGMPIVKCNLTHL